MTEAEFADYWDWLVDKKHRSPAKRLSKNERIFYAANIFRGAVPRSGLIGFFEHTECAVIRDAHEALAVLKLPEALMLLQTAQQIVLKGRQLPRAKFLTLLDRDCAEEEFEKAMDALDREVADIQKQLYLQDETIFAALCRFAGEKGLGAESGG